MPRISIVCRMYVREEMDLGVLVYRATPGDAPECMVQVFQRFCMVCLNEGSFLDAESR